MRKYGFPVWGWLLCAACVFMFVAGSTVAQQADAESDGYAAEVDAPNDTAGQQTQAQPKTTDAESTDQQANDDKPAAEKPVAEKKPPSASKDEKAKPKAKRGGAGPSDPPAYYKKQEETEIVGPSVVEGQAAGIEVGDLAPDFQLEPIQPYPYLQEWLGDDAPESLEKNITLSDLVREAPVMLLFGSYT